MKDECAGYCIFAALSKIFFSYMSNKISAAITAVGAYVPEYRLTNAELETMVETSDEWIKTAPA